MAQPNDKWVDRLLWSITRSALYGMCRHVKALVRWARRKFKPLRRHKTKAMKFLEGISKQNPYLFVHWRAGMIGGFAYGSGMN